MRADHDIRVEIPGGRPPVVVTLDAHILDRIWASICHLPMPRSQCHLLERRLTGPCAVRDLIRDLAADSVLVIPVGGLELRIRWAHPSEEAA
ncbi:hypothetical protein [Streptomyces sp. NRRL S-350]|uniref:hypothetical protein n=1 Tax=Streptomyces sp. NRRL S-350 TaxID=1463902 RepID=UPI0004BE833F|nr:hypothetical protein [Streptomyces sp. NRRL S-350]